MVSFMAIIYFKGGEIMKRLERLKSKILLSKMKTFLIEERRRSYYRDEMNVKELIPLEKDKKLVVYENGMIDFIQYQSKKLIKERR